MVLLKKTFELIGAFNVHRLRSVNEHAGINMRDKFYRIIFDLLMYVLAGLFVLIAIFKISSHLFILSLVIIPSLYLSYKYSILYLSKTQYMAGIDSDANNIEYARHFAKTLAT